MEPTPEARSVYIVWAGFQRRALSLQKDFKYDLRHLPTEANGKLSKLHAYWRQARHSIRLASQRSVKVVWLQLPPTFLVHLLVAYRALTRRSFKIVADCHNASLRPPWSRLPLFYTVLNRCDLILVHNDDVARDATALGVAGDRLLVLEDAPAYRNRVPTSHVAKDGEGHVLVPCSFHNDEPILEVLDAARAFPDVTFKITGPRARAEAKGYVGKAPANVIFTGFVCVEEYDKLVWTARAILGLTLLDGIQLSVAGEAISAGRPLILSNTSTLRRLYGQGARFTENTAASLEAALFEVLTHQTDWAARSAICARSRMAVWSEQRDQVKVFLS